MSTICWSEQDMVVLPYKDSLLLFSRYLQQLVMESIGKEFDLDGNRVSILLLFWKIIANNLLRCVNTLIFESSYMDAYLLKRFKVSSRSAHVVGAISLSWKKWNWYISLFCPH